MNIVDSTNSISIHLIEMIQFIEQFFFELIDFLSLSPTPPGRHPPFDLIPPFVGVCGFGSVIDGLMMN